MDSKSDGLPQRQARPATPPANRGLLAVNQGSLSPMSSSNSSTSPRAPGATRPANAPQQSKVDLSEIFPETPPKKTLSMPRTLTGVGKPATLSSPPTERPPQPPSAASSVSPRGVANRPHSKAVNADELHRRSVSVPETVTQATLEVVREYSANNSTSANATTARSPPVQPGKKITDILGDTFVPRETNVVVSPRAPPPSSPRYHPAAHQIQRNHSPPPAPPQQQQQQPLPAAQKNHAPPPRSQNTNTIANPVMTSTTLPTLDERRSRHQSRLTDKIQERFKNLNETTFAAPDTPSPGPPIPSVVIHKKLSPRRPGSSRIGAPTVSDFLSTRPESWSQGSKADTQSMKLEAIQMLSMSEPDDDEVGAQNQAAPRPARPPPQKTVRVQLQPTTPTPPPNQNSNQIQGRSPRAQTPQTSQSPLSPRTAAAPQPSPRLAQQPASPLPHQNPSHPPVNHHEPTDAAINDVLDGILGRTRSNTVMIAKGTAPKRTQQSSNAPVKGQVINDPTSYHSCSVCGAFILLESCLQFDDSFCHDDCFKCANCGTRCDLDLFYRDEKNFYCTDCRHILSPNCFHCGKVISGVCLRDNATKNPFHEGCYDEFQSLKIFEKPEDVAPPPPPEEIDQIAEELVEDFTQNLSPPSSQKIPAASPMTSTLLNTQVRNVSEQAVNFKLQENGKRNQNDTDDDLVPFASGQHTSEVAQPSRGTPAMITHSVSTSALSPISPRSASPAATPGAAHPDSLLAKSAVSPRPNGPRRVASTAGNFGFVPEKSEEGTDSSGARRPFEVSMKLFSSFKRAKTNVKMNLDWDDYINSLNDNLNNIKPTEHLRKLIRYKGIPAKFKEAVWVRITSVIESYSQNMNCYENVLSIKGAATNLSTSQIEKDIDRTFPNNVYFHSDEGRQSLFRVLHAFSWINPDIGYCQSMNFLAGLLLLFASEESTFWLLSTIVEEILPPDYYTPLMTGIRADALVFNLLLAERMPQVMKHIDGLGVDLTMFTTQWFLCLYINYLPTETVMWFVDCILSEGNKMLFRVALGLFAMYKSEILKTTDVMEMMNLIRSLPKRVTKFETLLQYCFLHPLTANLKREHIEELRVKSYELIDEVSPSATPTTRARPTSTHFFDRPSGESARKFEAWTKKVVYEDYNPLNNYQRFKAVQRRGALALGDEI